MNISRSEDAAATFDHDFKAKKPPANAENDFEIPKMVASFESCPRRRRCNSDRRAVPWPSLNLPFVMASERLKERLSSEKVEKAMISLLKRSVKELAKQDKDGDTMLMCLVGNSDELDQKMAYLVPLVERLSTLTGALTVTNDRGEDALYLAALNCPQFPYVAGYLAATMLQKEIDISQRLYHTRGETLIHAIAAQGDSHAETLAELLALRTNQGHAVFDLSKRNYDGRTALHVGVESHQPLTSGITSVDTVKWLLKYGADPKCKETKGGGTALHMAVSISCDPTLVKTLLVSHASDFVNAINYNHDTALHVAAATSDTVPLEKQTEVCALLIQAGARTNLSNCQGKTPLALVSPERKQAIRKIFYKIS
ncbi:NF-kappa-B inhibitor zeta [Anthophora plagiata]